MFNNAPGRRCQASAHAKGVVLDHGLAVRHCAPVPQPHKPRIVADAAIINLANALGAVAEVVPVPSEAITAKLLAHTRADGLLVRSVTAVGRELLAGSQVRFVASATAGFDHVEREWLAQQQITFAHAPGCNAPAVVHWVVSALLWAVHIGAWSLDGPVGVVGVGQVGRRLVHALRGIGLRCMLSDPPLAAAGGLPGEQFYSLSEVVAACPTISLHVPLTRTGRDATWHMLDTHLGFSGQLINTSRGDVCTSSLIAEAPPRSLILDVWPGEPNLPWEALGAGGPVLLASPHVAGYSRASKLRATAMVASAVCEHFGLPGHDLAKSQPRAVLDTVKIPAGSTAIDVCACVLAATCALREDDTQVRALSHLKPHVRTHSFEVLRRSYDLRHQPHDYRLGTELWAKLAPWLGKRLVAGGPQLASVLRTLGFALPHS